VVTSMPIRVSIRDFNEFIPSAAAMSARVRGRGEVLLDGKPPRAGARRHGAFLTSA